MRKRLALVLLLLQGLMTPGGGIGTGDISKDDFPQIPTQSPHTLERACTTRLGFCRVAGARVDGYVIAYRFSDVPSVVK